MVLVESLVDEIVQKCGSHTLNSIDLDAWNSLLSDDSLCDTILRKFAEDLQFIEGDVISFLGCL